MRARGRGDAVRLTGLAAAVVAAASGHPAWSYQRVAGPPIRVVRSDAGGLVPMPGGALLAWENRGRIAARDAAGTWGPAVVTGVMLEDAVPDPEGALLLGDVWGPGRSLTRLILLVGSDARERARWELPNLPVTSVARVHGRRWASACERGLVELMSAGKFEARAPAEFFALLLAGADGTPVVCVPRNLTMANYSPPFCHSVEGRPWREFGTWSGRPFACGGAIIERDKEMLLSRSIRDGRVLGHLRISPRAVAACGGPAEMLVASDSQVAGYGPEDLVRKWNKPVKAAGVTAVARAGEDVVLLRRQGGPVTLRPGGP